MSYAIFRSEPIYKLKDLGQIGSHNQRQKEAYQSNPDIDMTKTKDNIDIVPLSDKYIKGFYEITKEYKKEHDIRQKTTREEIQKSFSKMIDDSKSVVADEMLFTSDNDFFKDMKKKDIIKWANTCMDFVYEDLGYTKEQVLHATIHMDEKTPHLHCVVVPLVKKYDKRMKKEKLTISKKKYIKDKAHLSELQDKYHQRLVNKGFDLQRGIKNSDNEHISIKEYKKITRKLDNRLEKQNYLMTRDYEMLEEKLETSKPTITGKEVKIDKDTYDTLKTFMNTSKRTIEDMPKNQALFNELNEYNQTYRNIEIEKNNIQYEVYQLQAKNRELKKENNRLKEFIEKIVEACKTIYCTILKKGNEYEKDEVVETIIQYHEEKLYKDKDLRDIADNTTKEKEINDYIRHSKNKYKDNDFDMKM